jgi:hypothetical protein
LRLEHIKRSIAFVFLSVAAYAADPETVVLRNFSPGLQTDQDSSAIADTASPDLLNVDVEDGNIRTRGGSVAVSTSALGGYSSSAVRFLYEYVETDGDRWVISAASATIFKSNNGGQNNSVLTSTHGFTTSSDYCAVTAFGTMRLTDGTTNWITWNGSVVGVSTTAPHGATCAFFGERVWTSVGSTLYATNTDDVEDWSDGGTVDSDAISQPVRFNDGQGLTCLFPFKDRLLLFKEQSLDAYVRNADGLTYDLVSVSNNIGTSHCNSVVEREGDVVFLGPDAFYKYEPGTAAYKGYAGSVARISDIIEPTVKSITQLNSNSTFHIETGQSDFAAGTLAQMSASISAGDIVLSSWTATDDSISDFEAFSSSSNVNITNGRVYLSTNNTNVPRYTTSFGADWDNDSCTNATDSPSSDGDFTSKVTCKSFPENTFITLKLMSVDGLTVLASTRNSVGTTNDTWFQRTLSCSSCVGRFVRVLFVSDNSPGVFVSTLSLVNPVLHSGGDTSFWFYRKSSNSDILIDQVEGGVSTILSGSLTGQSRDTSFSNPSWIATTPTYTENSHSITWQTQASSDGVSWDSAVSWTPGSAPASSSKRYIRYVVTLSTGGTTNGVALPFVETVPLAARASTGTYQGAHFATSITSFGPVDITETLNSGQTAYAVFTDTNTSATFSNSSTWISSQTVTDGSVPTLTPSTYAFFMASATITAGTQNPTISELSLALTGGTQAPVWSEYHFGTYLASISTASTSGTDSILLYDRNTAWTMYDHDFYCLKRLLSGAILGGSNSDGKIYRFRDTSLESDSGTGINAYWRSKDFDFGIPVGDKTLLRYYVTGDYKTNSDAVFSYGVNRGTPTTATLDLDSTVGFFRKTIIPTSIPYQKGVQHYFKISNSDADDSFVINAVGIKVRAETEP